MADLFLLSEAQMRRIELLFSAVARDRAGGRSPDLSAIVFVIRNGLALARRAEGIRSAQDDLQPLHPLEPPGRVQQDLRRAGAQGRQAGTDLMIDATHLKAHRTAASLLKKGLFPDVLAAPRAA